MIRVNFLLVVPLIMFAHSATISTVIKVIFFPQSDSVGLMWPVRTVLAAYAVIDYHSLLGLKQYKLYSFAVLERGAEVSFTGIKSRS